jgi:hypothetical protein
MDRRDLRVSREVGRVQREQMGYTVNHHGRDQPRIVNLLSGYRAGIDKIAPRRVDQGAIREKHHSPLDRSNLLLRLSGREAKAVYGNRACGHIPKLRNVLVCEVKDRAGPAKGSDGPSDESMVWIIPARNSQQNVAVNQVVVRGTHQS